MSDSDLPWLFELSVDPETNYRWIFEGTVPTYGELGSFDELLSVYPIRWIVSRRRSEQRAGIVLVGPVDMANRTAQLGVCISPARAGRGLGAVAMLTAAYVLFEVLEMAKVSSYAPEFNEMDGYRHIGSFVTREGVLREHHFFEGRYWDVRVYGVLRSEWTSSMRPTFERILGPITVQVT